MIVKITLCSFKIASQRVWFTNWNDEGITSRKLVNVVVNASQSCLSHGIHKYMLKMMSNWGGNSHQTLPSRR